VSAYKQILCHWTLPALLSVTKQLAFGLELADGWKEFSYVAVEGI